MMHIPFRTLATAYHSTRVLLCLLCAVGLSTACGGGDEPIALGDRVPEMGGRNAGTQSAGVEMVGAEMAGAEMAGAEMAGAEMAGAEMPGAAMAGTQTETICETTIDEARFAAEVGPTLITTCATAFCHEPDGPTGFDLPVSALDFSPPLEGQLLTDTLEATMGEDSEYIVPGEPQQSKMLVYAANGHGGVGVLSPMTPEYDALYSWIEEMYQCREVEIPQAGDEVAGEMVPGGEDMNTPPGANGSSELCDLLPNGDPQNRADGQYYEVFVDEANGILTGSCGGGNCHATPDNGFWLRGDDETCAIESNFLMTQAYINFADPNRSPILEAAYDPYHSGYTIFTGRNDPRFITLQSWILLGFEE